MSPIAIAIIFGLAYPAYNWIANAFLGSGDEEVKSARSRYIQMHIGASAIGAIMALAVPLAYWILVLRFLC